MIDKKLHFPSMEDPDDDDAWSDNNDSLLEELFVKNKRGEYERFSQNGFDDDHPEGWDDLGSDDLPDDGIRAGELEAFNKAKEIIGGEDEFHYFPDDATEENNRKFAMKKLRENFGADTSTNIGVARWFFLNFLNENLIREAHTSGIGSHPLMILEFYKAARAMERLADNRDGEIKTLKFRSMDRVRLQKLEERARDLACRAYSQAKDAIIQMHGGISHG